MKYNYFQEKKTGARGAPTNVVNEVLFSGEEDWCSWSAYKCCK